MSEIRGLPRSLDQWTFDIILDLVRNHAYEPGWFDFKEVLRPTVSHEVGEYRRGLRKAICAFANTDGGYLIFGVRDAKTKEPPERRIVGIPVGGDLRNEVGKIVARVQPNVQFGAVPAPLMLPTDDTRGVYVIHVPRSLHRPHMVLDDNKFYRRDEGGANDPMDYYQVRDQLLVSEERLRKVALLRLHVAQYLRIAEKMEQAPNPYTPYRFDAAGFTGLVADVIGLIQPDSLLPEKLLEAPLFANRVNVVLDRIIHGGPHNPWAQGQIDSALYDVKTACEFIAREIDALFGDVIPRKSVSQLP